jgi:hypothetical protein
MLLHTSSETDPVFVIGFVDEWWSMSRATADAAAAGGSIVVIVMLRRRRALLLLLLTLHATDDDVDVNERC